MRSGETTILVCRATYILLRMHVSNLEMRKECHLFEAFFEAFVDLFGAYFLCLKDHFCVSRIVLSQAKIHNSDERVGEEKID